MTNLASNYSRTYEGPQRIFSDVEMKFNANSSVFFGGLPSNEKVGTLVYRSLDNEIIGGIKFLSTWVLGSARCIRTNTTPLKEISATII